MSVSKELIQTTEKLLRENKDLRNLLEEQSKTFLAREKSI
jgi:hypothetical protein